MSSQAKNSRPPVTDSIITPFVRQKLVEGYEIKKRLHGGCDLLQECPDCHNKYLYTFIKSGVETKLCPHCETLGIPGAIAVSGSISFR